MPSNEHRTLWLPEAAHVRAQVMTPSSDRAPDTLVTLHELTDKPAPCPQVSYGTAGLTVRQAVGASVADGIVRLILPRAPGQLSRALGGGSGLSLTPGVATSMVSATLSRIEVSRPHCITRSARSVSALHVAPAGPLAGFDRVRCSTARASSPRWGVAGGAPTGRTSPRLESHTCPTFLPTLTPLTPAWRPSRMATPLSSLR